MWKESLYDPKYCPIAVEVLSRGKSLAAVCVACGVCRATLYNWRDTHPDFKDALNFGVQNAQALWEDRGERGIEGEIKNFAGSTYMFTMKNRFRDDYNEDKEAKSASDSFVEKLIDKLSD
tara:strand:+ start:1113 stop:1472 length:360 start_codon:yes stop_codon:yes gene_type:complete